ncbi:HAUS augmin-like complex subunit 5 isoform X2 [Terrapene carolina triunguis]|uniref:HAUS augmin-like complex subunit 5 isoform X2 n=1 Tax=Terrapene triunguis TaxID=2587831 RepID=UPI000E7767EC|nr:HAUS augmin-like complex subunit 5 isoform X2 [Terrapene carolina triunguis]
MAPVLGPVPLPSGLQVPLRERPPGRPGGASSSPALSPGPHTGPGLRAEEAAGPGAGRDAGIAAGEWGDGAQGLVAGSHRPLLPAAPQPPGVPAHELSIHRLGRMALAQHRASLIVCQASGFPLYKTLEHLLPHMAELKKELLALRAQLGYKSQALASLQQHQGSPGTDAQALVQALRDHDREQAGALGPRIRLVTEQCEQRIERWPEVQAAIDAWWEQPGQFALPAEHRLGLTLQQWLERWTLALKTLQQQHSWA